MFIVNCGQIFADSGVVTIGPVETRHRAIQR